MGWRNISSFSISSTRMGSAVTAQAMPMPSTTCQSVPCGPIHWRLYDSITAPAAAPNSNGTISASPAVTPVSPRRFHASSRSSSIPASQTNSITAHQAMPFSAWITSGRKTKP